MSSLFCHVDICTTNILGYGESVLTTVQKADYRASLNLGVQLIRMCGPYASWVSLSTGNLPPIL